MSLHMKPACILFAVCALPASLGAQVPRDSVTALARRWAPRWVVVTCGNRGREGDVIRPQQLFCEWRVPAPEVLVAHVSTVVDGMSNARWERRFPTDSGAAQFVDSLGTALVTAGFLGRRCSVPPGSRLEPVWFWETKSVAVFLLRSVTEVGSRVVTMATSPGGLPVTIREQCKSNASPD